MLGLFRLIGARTCYMGIPCEGLMRTLQQGLFYPLELAWTRLVADTSPRGAPRTYQGLLHCLQTTARLEGVPGECMGPSGGCGV